MKSQLSELLKLFGKDRIRENEPMSLHTTFKIGGPAQYYLEVQKLEALISAVKIAKNLNLPMIIIGFGSNILVSDKGIKGLVIKNNCRKFDLIQLKGKVKDKQISFKNVFVYAESGVIVNQLVRFTIEQGLEGFEYNLGLPGTVGGAIFMNSNFPKKQSSVGDSLYSAKILTQKGETMEVDNSYFNFKYDKSILQKSKDILLSAIFKLKSSDKNDLWKKGMEASKYRGITYPDKPSAGCIFQNISLSEAIKASTPNGITSAGYLIEKAGLKGKRIGDAIVSKTHANFILNMGKAKAEEVEKLIEEVKTEVFKKFGVKLSLEIQVIGF